MNKSTLFLSKLRHTKLTFSLSLAATLCFLLAMIGSPSISPAFFCALFTSFILYPQSYRLVRNKPLDHISSNKQLNRKEEALLSSFSTRPRISRRKLLKLGLILIIFLTLGSLLIESAFAAPVQVTSAEGMKPKLRIYPRVFGWFERRTPARMIGIILIFYAAAGFINGLFTGQYIGAVLWLVSFTALGLLIYKKLQWKAKSETGARTLYS